MRRFYPPLMSSTMTRLVFSSPTLRPAAMVETRNTQPSSQAFPASAHIVSAARHQQQHHDEALLSGSTVIIEEGVQKNTKKNDDAESESQKKYHHELSQLVDDKHKNIIREPSLLEQYTAPGTPKQHPLELLSAVIPQLVEASLAAAAAAHRQQNPESLSASSSSSSSLWPPEQVQIVTADAARRIARAARAVVDDDVDLGVAAGRHDDDSGSESSSSNSNSALLRLPAALGDTALNTTSENTVATFAEEQRLFDQLHEALFLRRSAAATAAVANSSPPPAADCTDGGDDSNEGLVHSWVRRWMSNHQVRRKSNGGAEGLLLSRSSPDDVGGAAEDLNRLMVDALADDHAVVATTTTTNNDAISGPVDKLIIPSPFDNQQNAAADDDGIAVFNDEGDDELASIVTLLQRHILLASLAHRFDAAVEAFMLLARIRSGAHGKNVVRSSATIFSDRRSAATVGGAVDIHIVTWRHLRDVISACAAAAAAAGSSTIAHHQQQNYYDTAETLLRYVVKQCLTPATSSTTKVAPHHSGGGWWLTTNTPSDDPTTENSRRREIKSLVPPEVLSTLAKCIRSSDDLKRFRQLMAVECSPGGVLEHIPVSAGLYTQLIAACSRCNDEPRRQEYALMFMRAIADNGLVPTPATYAAMVACYGSDGECTQAFSMFHEAKRTCDPTLVAACPPLYNGLIEAYCNAGKLHDAVATTNVLMEAAAPVTRRGFHAALMCCAVQGDLSQCLEFLTAMQGGGNERRHLATGPASSLNYYNVAPTPTTLAIALASLVFVKRELSWREKLTVIGDMVGDAFSVSPAVSAGSASAEANAAAAAAAAGKKEQDDGRGNNNSDSSATTFRQTQEVAMFCETEKFHCAVLLQVVAAAAICPPLSLRSGEFEHDTTDGDQKLLPRTREEQRQEGTTPTSYSSFQQHQKSIHERKLYRKHINLALRICQTHTQMTLSKLLHRALEKRLGADNFLHSLEAISTSSGRAAKRLVEQLLKKTEAMTLFTPQRPTVMPRGAKVAALMPDVVLNPFALSVASSSDSSDGGSSHSRSRGVRSSSTSSALEYIDEVGHSLVRLLESLLPTTTLFHLPFASLRSIVTEADALFMNDFPLFQRELYFSEQAAGYASSAAHGMERSMMADPSERNEAMAVQRRVHGRLHPAHRRGDDGEKKVGNKKISSRDLGRIIDSAADQRTVSTSPHDGDEQQHEEDRRPDFDGTADQSHQSSAATASGSITVHERERRLDHLADAVFALAVFLDAHGEKVHVGSALEDVDASRAAAAMRLSLRDPIQRAAAVATAAVFSPLGGVAVRGGGGGGGNSGDMFNVVNAAMAHHRHVLASSRRRNKKGSSLLALSSSSSWSPVLSSSSSSSSFISGSDDTADVLSLYFNARVNLSLVTCDAGLRRVSRDSHDGASNKKKFNFATVLSALKRLARDVAELQTVDVVSSDYSSVEEERNQNAFRNISGASTRLKSLTSQQMDKRRRHDNDGGGLQHDNRATREKRCFDVCVVDPMTSVVV